MLRAMPDDLALGRMVRIARHRERLRQADVAAELGIGRHVVVEIEAGHLEEVRIGELRAVGARFDLRLPLEWKARRGGHHQLTDTGHAALVERLAEWLTECGWIVRVEEISAAGSIDVLAFHAPSRTLLVVEVKTQIVDIQKTFRELGYRQASARQAAEALGWDPSTISVLLVVGDTSAQRRLVKRHEHLFAARFPTQGWDARHWIAAPGGSTGLLVFLASVPGRTLIQTDGARVRLRRPERASREPKPRGCKAAG